MTSSNGNHNKKSWIEIIAVIAALMGAIAALLTALLGDGGIGSLINGKSPQGTNTTPNPNLTSVSSSTPTSNVNVNPTITSQGGNASTGGVTVNPIITSQGGNASTGNVTVNPSITSQGGSANVTPRNRPEVHFSQRRIIASDQQSVQPSDITREEYDAVQNGMTYEQVVQIIGSSGKSEGTNGPFTFYKWDDGGHFGVQMTFQNGKLVSKGPYQFGS